MFLSRFLTVPPQACRCKLASVVASKVLTPDTAARSLAISKTILENSIVTVFIEITLLAKLDVSIKESQLSMLQRKHYTL